MTGPATREGDYFSNQSGDYARYRPRYPAELFAYLATVAPARNAAWDCATGSGQAAVLLANAFRKVIATDLSEAQLRHRQTHSRVHYAVASAGASALRSRSIDLVTVAQALHWFDLDAFYAEVKRVLRPRGVVAVSSYGSAVIDDAGLSQALSSFEWGTLGSFWPPRRELVGEALRSLDFPFDTIEAPSFRLEALWTLPELIGYARSWSATARYLTENGRDPTPDLEAALRSGWGPPSRRRLVRWPFVLRVGRLPGRMQ